MFRLTMDTALFAGFAIAYLVLRGWALRLASGNGWWTLANVPLLVTAVLVYDNGIIAAGRFIGAGDLLLWLNMARFGIHAIVTPLLVMWAWHSAHRNAATRVARLDPHALDVSL